MLLNLKKINVSNKPIWLKYPSFRDVNLLAMFKHDRGVELGSIEEQLQISGQRGPRDPRILSPAP